MKILICGATYFTDYERFHDEVAKILIDLDYARYVHPFEPHKFTVISGMAKGADTMAVKFAEQYGLPLLEFPADWNRYGKGAGPVRNQRMLDEGKPDLIIAFPMKVSKGTRDMIARGLLENVKVIVVEV